MPVYSLHTHGRFPIPGSENLPSEVCTRAFDARRLRAYCKLVKRSHRRQDVPIDRVTRYEHVSQQYLPVSLLLLRAVVKGRGARIEVVVKAPDESKGATAAVAVGGKNNFRGTNNVGL